MVSETLFVEVTRIIRLKCSCKKTI